MNTRAAILAAWDRRSVVKEIARHELPGDELGLVVIDWSPDRIERDTDEHELLYEMLRARGDADPTVESDEQ